LSWILRENSEGKKVKLQDQPVQILQILVERLGLDRYPGRVTELHSEPRFQNLVRRVNLGE